MPTISRFIARSAGLPVKGWNCRARPSATGWAAPPVRAPARAREPLYDLMRTLILLCGTIHTDDTPVKVRDSERKIKATSRLWIYFGDYLHPYNVFHFT